MKCWGILLGIMLTSIVVQAQKWSVGVSGGWVLTHLLTEDNSHTTFHSGNGWNTTVFADYRLTKQFWLQPEWSYGRECVNYRMADGVIGDYSYSGDIKMDYTRLALLGKYSYGKKFRIFGQMGIGVRFLLAAKKSYDAGGVRPGADGVEIWNKSEKMNIRKNLKLCVADVAAGAGISYLLTPDLEVFTKVDLCLDLSCMDDIHKQEAISDVREMFGNKTRFLKCGWQAGIAYILKTTK